MSGLYSNGLRASSPGAIQGEAQIKQAFVDGYLTDAEFESLIAKAVRGEQSTFFLGDRQPDPLFGPDLITDPDIPTDEPGRIIRYTPPNAHTGLVTFFDPKNPEDAEPDGNWESA